MKVQSHMAVFCTVLGVGDNPLALILPLQGACSHLFLQVCMQAETPVRAAAVMRAGYPVPTIFPSQC